MKHFSRPRKKVLIGFLLSFAAFFAFNIVIFQLRYEVAWMHVLRFPFALLVPQYWSNDSTLLGYNILITLIPLASMLFALVQPRNGNLVAVAHIALVLYWAHVFRSVLVLVGI